jgi:hypothetical protein
MPQKPAEHTGLAFAGEHAAPHEPQWSTVDVTSVSHPFDASPSQLPYPALHATSHVPPLHAADPFARSGHAVPHAPQ